ncbi:hypothetical protein AB1Y20_016356 [Prymnesium parvum]|uniref:Uncharacterized protein n=1 Tax=Prymnesium parvum TaxID=97485 RepID=A0AB34IEZ8_PRYPA
MVMWGVRDGLEWWVRWWCHVALAGVEEKAGQEAPSVCRPSALPPSPTSECHGEPPLDAELPHALPACESDSYAGYPRACRGSGALQLADPADGAAAAGSTSAKTRP